MTTQRPARECPRGVFSFLDRRPDPPAEAIFGRTFDRTYPPAQFLGHPRRSIFAPRRPTARIEPFRTRATL